jgi:hypothetical protein
LCSIWFSIVKRIITLPNKEALHLATDATPKSRLPPQCPRNC